MKLIMQKVAEARKAFVPLIVGAIVAAAARYGLPLTDEQTAFVTALVTALWVYAVPNATTDDTDPEV